MEVFTSTPTSMPKATTIWTWFELRSEANEIAQDMGLPFVNSWMSAIINELDTLIYDWGITARARYVGDYNDMWCRLLDKERRRRLNG